MRVQVYLVIVCVAVILFSAAFSVMNWSFFSRERVEASLSDVRDLMNALAGDVFLMCPKGSPPGEQYLYDVFMNVCRNRPQMKIYYKTNFGLHRWAVVARMRQIL